ncbi:hypothetical protein V8J82_02650 [Gymnodinialimonas sp. 2305UL16-5]|uniref:phospholipase D family protein n=1 Tax=Gymnodinialimonas mytili TaxID=3126503 RepID=UPI003099096D
MTPLETKDEAIESLEILLTAEEAFLALETQVLNATRSFVGCFRVFDLRTRLHSAAAQEVGETWFDLILDALNRGVTFDLTVADFDPIAATPDHRRSWSSARQFAALDELSHGARIHWTIAMHPARVGLLPRLAFQAKARKELADREPDPLTPGLEERKDQLDLPLVPATHHQKLAVIDDRILYLGGLDLNERRFDTKDHDRPADQTWQDIHTLSTGPVVHAALRHLETFRQVTAGERSAPEAAPGFLRTLSGKRKAGLVHISPKPEITEIEAAHLAAIEASEGPIYLETQFFRHRPLADALAEAATRRSGLTCTMVLPAAPEDVAFEDNDKEDAQLGAQLQMDCIDTISEAFGQRLALAAPARPVAAPDELSDNAQLYGAPIIYVHSKLSLFGLTEGVISSANLNGRSMKWDTEAGLHVTRPEHLRDFWNRALEHWLGSIPIDPLEDQLAYIEWLNGDIARNMVTAPHDRTHFLLPYPRGRDIELAAPLPGVPDALV